MISSNTKFAAFVMTYQRNETLVSTLRTLLNQTVPPQKILIVDNDPGKGALSVLEHFTTEPVHYFSVGYNSGPAGAAEAGLKILADEGFDWILWTDDDDPPIFENTFELLINMAENHANCGCVGAVGQRYKIDKGMIDRVADIELGYIGSIEVDNIAGGMSKIVSGRAVREKNILPDAGLFFGFEELDFDLRLKKAGFVLLADRSFYKKHRDYNHRTGIKIQRGKKKPVDKLWREYYSTRNSLYIVQKHQSFVGKINISGRAIIKSVVGFRYGWTYGKLQAKYLLLGLFHYLIGRKGKCTFA